MGIDVTRPAEADLVVRPDALVVDVTLGATDPEPRKALAITQALSADLLAQLQRASGGAAALKMRGTSVVPIGTVKSKQPDDGRPDPDAAFEVKTDGTLEVALAQELDYWKRSELLITVAQTIRTFARANEVQPDDEKHERRVMFGHSRVIVRDPEAFRAQLIERWVARARAFAAAVQSNEAPLHIPDCVPPGEIVQREHSLEEVGLHLTVTCRLGSSKAPALIAPLPH